MIAKRRRLIIFGGIALFVIGTVLALSIALSPKKNIEPDVGDITVDASIQVMMQGEHEGNTGIVYRQVNALSKLINNQELLTVIAFYQPRDPQNHTLLPILEDLAFKTIGKTQFIWLDAKRELGWDETYDVRVTPTLLFLRQNTIYAVLKGDDCLKQDLVQRTLTDATSRKN